jgi:hypothetical protein
VLLVLLLLVAVRRRARPAGRLPWAQQQALLRLGMLLLRVALPLLVCLHAEKQGMTSRLSASVHSSSSTAATVPTI